MRYTHFLAAAILVTACSPTSAQQARRQSAGDVVATVGAVSITLAQVDDKALEQPVSSFGSGPRVRVTRQWIVPVDEMDAVPVRAQHLLDGWVGALAVRALKI